VSEDARRHRLRATFEEVPELYDRARPSYPPEVFDDLIDLAGLARGARLLEIGCGTGKATIPLAERGFEVVCVELGERLARVARSRLAAFPTVEVVNARFETWEPEPPGGAFDAVVSFAAFHWIDPEVRYHKAADLLRERGSLAVANARHVLPDARDTFWVEVQDDYDAVVPGDNGPPPPHPDAVADLSDDIERSGRFRNVGSRRYVWQLRYAADEYIAVLDTYSGHRALPDDQRERLYTRIRRRIGAQPEQAVTKSYLTTLNVAERRD
jgi:SAM-dependent methyltransferase